MAKTILMIPKACLCLQVPDLCHFVLDREFAYVLGSASTPTMLRYLNAGLRSGQTLHPLGLRRGNWEFFAVVKGRMRPAFPDRVPGPFQEMRLWLMPPESPHAWFTPAHESSHVFVFHFASIHPLLEAALPSSRMLSIGLKQADSVYLKQLYDHLLDHYRTPKLSSAVHFESAMLALCILFLERCREIANVSSFNAGAEKILQAVQWHREHFSEGVGVNEVAAALNLSPGHLRRLFKKFRHESPKHAFARYSLEEACRMMAHNEHSIKEIAALCGFGGFSEFYRAFKKYTGISPSQWRENAVYKGKIAPATAARLTGVKPPRTPR